MRLLITGGSSYLGQHLTPMALAAAGFSEIRYTYFQNDPLNHPAGARLDVRQPTAVAHCIQAFQPDVIIHTIGSNRGGDLESVIVGGAENVVRAAGRARLIHLSTDCVFDGKTPPYPETAAPTPINAYGRAKAQAEAIIHLHPNHVIIRTSLIYSLTLMDHGTRWMSHALRAGKPVTLFANQLRQPVWAESLSCSILELARRDFSGILHIAGAQLMSRSQFALKMLDWWQVSKRDTLQIGQADGTQWPLDLTLDLSRATAVLSTNNPGVDAILRQHPPE